MLINISSGYMYKYIKGLISKVSITGWGITNKGSAWLFCMCMREYKYKMADGKMGKLSTVWNTVDPKAYTQSAI